MKSHENADFYLPEIAWIPFKCEAQPREPSQVGFEGKGDRDRDRNGGGFRDRLDRDREGEEILVETRALQILQSHFSEIFCQILSYLSWDCVVCF